VARSAFPASESPRRRSISEAFSEVPDITEIFPAIEQYQQPSSWLQFAEEVGDSKGAEDPIAAALEDLETEKEQLESRCDNCDSEIDLSWCQLCELTFCDRCWSLQAAHGAKKTKSPSTRVHEKTDIKLRNILGQLMRRQSDTMRNQKHRLDGKTLWFGTAVDMAANTLSLNFTDRLSSLGSRSDQKVPSIISFMGETGAGKSGLVQSLLKVGRALCFT
jgi:hypothetical protein